MRVIVFVSDLDRIAVAEKYIMISVHVSFSDVDLSMYFLLLRAKCDMLDYRWRVECVQWYTLQD